MRKKYFFTILLSILLILNLIVYYRNTGLNSSLCNTTFFSGVLGALLIYVVIINIIYLFRLYSLKAKVNAKYSKNTKDIFLPQLKLYDAVPDDKKIVYVSETGKMYHKFNCSYLSYARNMENLIKYKGYRSFDLSYAKRVYTPCPKCFKPGFTPQAKFIKNIPLLPSLPQK